MAAVCDVYEANLKKGLQEKIKTENRYVKRVEKLETDKKRKIKEHDGFENTTGETDKKAIEKSEAFQEWKKEVTDDYNQQINDLKEELETLYQSKKQEVLKDYPIFMAIAEDIGYDATGKPTGNNELKVIETELIRFINRLVSNEII